MSLGSNTPGNRTKTMQSSTFLSRLRRDQKGNALAIVAASIIPLVGAIGGGVDLTRAYMAEARLAQACDAAALAGRKVMTKDDTTENGTVIADSTAGQEIQRFLDYNFPEGKFSTGEITRTAEVDDQGELTITLATAMPTQLLRIAGIQSMELNAECSARRSGVNVDVALVVDVTGSMAWDIDKSSGDDNERMIALQDASKTFFGILNELQGQLASSGLRVRVGVVPYSHTVNVGKLLYAENADYIAQTAQYYTDVYRVERTSRVSGGQTQYKWLETSTRGSVEIDLADFIDKGINDSTNPYAWKGCVEARWPTVKTISSSSHPYQTIPSGAWDVIDAAPGSIVNGETAPKWQPFFYSPLVDPGNVWRPNTSTLDMKKLPWDATKAKSVHWRLNQKTSWDKSNADPSFITSTGSGKSKVEYNVVTSDHYKDGKVTLGPNHYCVEQAKLLTQIDDDGVTALEGYIDGLVPYGGTYHDLGMYWGLALVSSRAPFENPDTYLASGFTGEKRGVNRYIVFMTDGGMSPSTSIYTAYGWHSKEKRVSSAGTPTEHHRARFRMICEAAKMQGISVSTIAFSDDVSDDDQDSLEGCASEEQAYVAETADDLNDAFRKIAQNIGYLRVSK